MTLTSATEKGGEIMCIFTPSVYTQTRKRKNSMAADVLGWVFSPWSF